MACADHQHVLRHSRVHVRVISRSTTRHICVSGFINAAKRVLNVDQAAVLVLDETAGTVELNRELLAR